MMCDIIFLARVLAPPAKTSRLPWEGPSSDKRIEWWTSMMKTRIGIRNNSALMLEDGLIQWMMWGIDTLERNQRPICCNNTNLRSVVADANVQLKRWEITMSMKMAGGMHSAVILNDGLIWWTSRGR